MTPKYAKDQPAGFVNRIEKVAVVGAGGQLGKWIAEALVNTGQHTVTGITRKESTNILPQGVIPAYVDYDDEDTLVAALQGQQALVITMFARATPGTQSKLVRAAAKAGVGFVMPNFWGYDPFDQGLTEMMGFGKPFAEFCEEVERLGVSQWITQACGYWYEFSLAGSTDRFGFDLVNRKVIFFDDGTYKINTSTFAQTARGIAALLSLKLYPEDAVDEKSSPSISRWVKGVCCISSFRVSQRDMYESLKRVTGTVDSDWTVSSEPSQERYTRAVADLQKGDFSGFTRMMYTRVFFPEGNSSYEDTRGLDNAVLGLPEEDLDEATKAALEYGLRG